MLNCGNCILFQKAGQKIKCFQSLTKHCKHFIATSPFAVISTIDKNGNMDASPKGGQPGFIKMLDEGTIMIPDSKGNNRLDGMENILETGFIGMLFFIPGINETLRLNGKAYLTNDKDLLTQFTEEKNPPKIAIVVSIEEVFLHCAKAFMRANLWEQQSMIDPQSFPSIGQMLKDQLNLTEDAESRDDMIKRYKKDL